MPFSGLFRILPLSNCPFSDNEQSGNRTVHTSIASHQNSYSPVLLSLMPFGTIDVINKSENNFKNKIK